MTMTDIRASCQLSMMMAIRLTMKSSRMRTLEMTSTAKKRRMASMSDVTRWTNSPVCVASWNEKGRC